MAIRISVNDIKPGMILTESIKKENEHDMLPQGTKLTTQHIVALKAWDVQAVTIADDEKMAEASLNEEIRLKAKNRVDGRMHWKPLNSFEEEIYHMAIQQVEHLLMEKEKG